MVAKFFVSLQKKETCLISISMQKQDRTKILNSNYFKNLSLLLKMPKQLGEYVIIYFTMYILVRTL